MNEEKNNIYTVYMHISPSGKKYIGITKQKPQKRWAYGCGYICNRAFYNAIKKYGWNNIEHIIVENNLSRDKAIEKEIDLIQKYKTYDKNYGYNITLGGEGCSGRIVTQTTRQKISESKIGHLVSEETKIKISQSKSGKNHYNYGKHLSIETRQKISQAKKGAVFSEEHKRNLSISHIGKTPANKGKPMKEETRQKIISTKAKNKKKEVA